MKKNIIFILSILSIFLISDNAFAASCNPTSIYYDGVTSFTPSTCYADDGTVLVPGVDYQKTYYFTNDFSDNGDDYSKYTPVLDNTTQSGFYWELNYSEDINLNYHVRLEIFSHIFVMAKDATKSEGDADPEFEYDIVINKNDPSVDPSFLDVTIEREEGETPGTYKLTPVVKIKEGHDIITMSGMYWGHELNSRVTLGVYPATLTITEKEEAKVIVKYQDTNGKELSDDVVIEGNVGETYKTEQKEIKGYHFVKVNGEKEGTFTKEDIEVIYIYDVDGEGGDDEIVKTPEEKPSTPTTTNVPKTGDDTDIVYILSTISVIFIVSSYLLKKEFT